MPHYSVYYLEKIYVYINVQVLSKIEILKLKYGIYAN